MQVRPAKAGDVLVRIAKPQLLDDVVPYALRGAGRECRDRPTREKLAQSAELPVFRPEFVAPLRNTVGFVDRKERNRYSLQPLRRIPKRHAFRRKIQQPEFSRRGALQYLASVFPAE